MIGAVAVGVESTAEVGGGEGCDLLGGAELYGGVVEGGNATGYIGDEISVRSELRFVEVEAADTREENLAFKTELRGGGDQSSDGAQLLPKAGIRERRSKRYRLRKDTGDERTVGNGVRS
jgi:hypothetical protein